MTADLAGGAAVLLVAAPIVAPVAAAGATVLMGWRRSAAVATVSAAAVILVVGAGTAAWTADGGVVAVGNWLRIDALSGLMLIVIGAVGVIAAWPGLGYVEGELRPGHTDATGARRYGVLVPLFLAAMVLAVLAAGCGRRR